MFHNLGFYSFWQGGFKFVRQIRKMNSTLPTSLCMQTAASQSTSVIECSVADPDGIKLKGRIRIRIKLQMTS
jgi:hypothetical protein